MEIPRRFTCILRGVLCKKIGQIAMFQAAAENSQEVILTIRMQNSPGNDSVVFEMTNAFVANWKLSNESQNVAYESIDSVFRVTAR